MAASTGPQLALHQYTKDIPPGFRPRLINFKDYQDRLKIWHRLTRLDDAQIPPAIVSRLEGTALDLANDYIIIRYNNPNDANTTTTTGIDALCLPDLPNPFLDQYGTIYQQPQPSGLQAFLRTLQD